MGCDSSKTIIPYEQARKKGTVPRKRHKHRHRDRVRDGHEQRAERISRKSRDDQSVESVRNVTIEFPGDDDEILQANNASLEIEVNDSEAFNQIFIKQRQQAIDNLSYRTAIETWQPSSLDELVVLIKKLSKGRSLIDRHWIIFYWITLNIEYDTVAYFTKDYTDQTAEGVFESKKGVCAGYGNVYKHLCDALRMPCEIVSGYSKGYGFDDRDGAPPEIDHAWNAVEIYHHWYLLESTWGAGILTKDKQFKRELASYYFLPRPNEMIYHHLPEEEQWQLLRTPISMEQYVRMPKLRPEYFEFNLDIVEPKHQNFVNLDQAKGFALVVMKAPADVHLMADLKLHDQLVEGGHQVVFDKRKRLYYCYFAPATIGKHKITIYAKRGDSELGTYGAALDFPMPVKQLPENRISYPKTWKAFFDLGLKILSPLQTHQVQLASGSKSTQISIRTPPDVLLMGQLTDKKETKIAFGHRVYHDRQKDLWRCSFAPNRKGIFEATILAKRASDEGNYISAVAFKIDASQITAPYLSFPNTWQLFHDLNLKILSPTGRGVIVLQEENRWAEIIVQAPDEVELLGRLAEESGEEIADGCQIVYDRENNNWLCKFAPNTNGLFVASIMAKKKSDSGYYLSAVSFQIDATQGSIEPASLMKTTQLFYDLGIEVLSPVETNTIILPQKSSFTEISIKTPADVELLGQLVDETKQKISDASQVYYDRRKDSWCCKFAPNCRGRFQATIMAKKKSHSGSYSSVIDYDIVVNHKIKAPVTFPQTWQAFFDFDLRIKSPRSRATAVWLEENSYAEVLLDAPNNIHLSCSIERDGVATERTALAQYDKEGKLWQCLFAPQQTGEHQLTIFARRIDDPNSSGTSVVRFPLNVTELQQPMEFPLIYTQFEVNKCRLLTPLNGVLQKNSVVPIHCIIPGATAVSVTVDSRNVRSEGYNDPVFQRQITVGSQEVSIYAKYGQSPLYTCLIKYTVE